MPRNVGRMDKWVTLFRGPITTPDSDGFLEPLSPSGAWAEIKPFSPGGGEGRAIQHQIRMRFHAQVNMDTWIQYGTRSIRVVGFQNTDENGDELVLFCEEVIP